MKMIRPALYACLFLLVLIAMVGSAVAQQDEFYTRAPAVVLPVNPAYAGHDKGFTMNLMYRNQWASVVGAPRTMEIHGHMPLMENQLGIGFRIVNDQLGVANATSLMTYYAYRLPLGPGRISFGIDGGVSQYTIQLTRTNPLDEGDPGFECGPQQMGAGSRLWIIV